MEGLRFLLLLYLVLVAGVIGAETPKAGGTLRLAFRAEPNLLDPIRLGTDEDGILAAMVYNTLVDFDPHGHLVPVLAESLPAISQDGLTYTFRLRPGVRFSNGRELIASDFVFSLSRFLNPQSVSSFLFHHVKGRAAYVEARKQEAASPFRAAYGSEERWIEPVSVEGFRALDSRTLQIQLDQPNLAFIQQLTYPTITALPQDEVLKQGAQFWLWPVGTGPFLIKEWTRGRSFRLERNPNYFQLNQPYLDGVDILPNVDETTRAMMFERGEVDFHSYIADPDMVRYRKDEKLTPCLQRLEGVNPVFISLNCLMPPFTNILVRQAMNHAVNKAALVKKLLHRGVAGRGALPMNISAYNPNLPEYAYDPGKARALLTEAGFGNGFESTLWVSREISSHLKVAQSVQQDLDAVGVRVQLKVVSIVAINDSAQRPGRVPMGVFYWGGTIDDPKETLDIYFNSNISEQGFGLNSAFYKSDRVQSLFQQADVELNPKRRIRLYQNIEECVVRDAPWIFLCYLDWEVIRQPWLKGFRLSGVWPSTRFETAWLEK
jgi:oligopeptide transport system substrate-binding protein